VLRPKRPAVKAAASWKKFLRELLMESSEKIDGNMMFGARILAIVGLTRFSNGRQNSQRKVNQRRRGEIDTKETESPGEEPLSAIRNANGTEAPERDGEFPIAKSNGEL
jgi:hypothetical protein